MKSSLLASTIQRLAVARVVAKQLSEEIGSPEITAVRIYMQVGDDGPSYELGHITASHRHTNQEIKAGIHDLLFQLAERWKA